jgi:NAD(P) transhydrogenase subunit alpha
MGTLCVLSWLALASVTMAAAAERDAGAAKPANSSAGTNKSGANKSTANEVGANKSGANKSGANKSTANKSDAGDQRGVEVAPKPTPDADADSLSPSARLRDEAEEEAASEPAQEEEAGKEAKPVTRQAALIASLTIFVLAIFVGFEIIAKVPTTLHTPLMSGSNAISGITIVGALLVAGHGLGVAPVLGLLAMVLAMINVVGGFLVTHRMLAMFKRK